MKLGKVIRYAITIEPSDNMGFMVKIGCGKFVAQDSDDLIILLCLIVLIIDPLIVGLCAVNRKKEIRDERPRIL